MRKVQVITDSTSDLSSALLDQYGIDFVKMNTVYQGKETPADLRWTPEDAHKLYDIIRGGDRITTTQVPVEEFMAVFKKYLDQGCDIVYIACASKQSGSVNTGNVTGKKLMEEYPGSTIICVDALNSCIGEGMIAIKTAEYAKQGKSAEECAAYAKSIRKHVREYATVHTLEHLKKAGRVTASSAFFGNLFGVKPILVADSTGAQAAYKKVKGRQAAMKECVNLLKAEGVTKGEPIFIAHSDCSKEEVDAMRALLAEAFPGTEVLTAIIGPIVGASIGPDTIGVWGWADTDFAWTAAEK